MLYLTGAYTSILGHFGTLRVATRSSSSCAPTSDGARKKQTVALLQMRISLFSALSGWTLSRRIQVPICYMYTYIYVYYDMMNTLYFGREPSIIEPLDFMFV